MQDSNDKGFALYDEAGGVAGEDVAAGGDLNEFFADLESAPVELLDDSKEFGKKDDDLDDLSDLDLSPGALDKSNDSVRVYLREMGMVPLLTREGEIELAKRIERGQNAIRKALSRSRLIVHLLLETKHDVERGNTPVFDVLQTPEAQIGQEEITSDQTLKEQFADIIQDI